MTKFTFTSIALASLIAISGSAMATQTYVNAPTDTSNIIGGVTGEWLEQQFNSNNPEILAGKSFLVGTTVFTYSADLDKAMVDAAKASGVYGPTQTQTALKDIAAPTATTTELANLVNSINSRTVAKISNITATGATYRSVTLVNGVLTSTVHEGTYDPVTKQFTFAVAGANGVNNKVLIDDTNRAGLTLATTNINGKLLVNGVEITSGAKGDKGDTGATGAQGAQGIQGIQGAKGEKGDDFNGAARLTKIEEQVTKGITYTGAEASVSLTDTVGRVFKIVAQPNGTYTMYIDGAENIYSRGFNWVQIQQGLLSGMSYGAAEPADSAKVQALVAPVAGTPKTTIGQDLDVKGNLTVKGTDVLEAINNETGARIAADNAINTRITTEVTRLDGRIDATNAKVANNTKRIDNIEKVGVAIAINTIVNDALPQEVKDAGISLSASTGGINVVKQLEGGAHLSVGANGVSLGASKDLNDNVRVHGGVGTEGASVGLYVHEKGNGVGISTSGPSVMINNHAIPLTPQGFVVSAITGAYKSVTGKTAKEINELKAANAAKDEKIAQLQATTAMQAEALAQLQAQVAAIVAAQAK